MTNCERNREIERERERWNSGRTRILTNSQREKAVTEVEDKGWRGKKKKKKRHHLERLGCNEGKDGRSRWKRAPLLAKQSIIKKSFESSRDPFDCFSSKADFCDRFRKGRVYGAERERERNKGSKATLLKLLEKFLVRPTPAVSFPPILGTPVRTKPRHTTLRPRELIRVPYFARLRRPSNINRQGRWRRQRRVLAARSEDTYRTRFNRGTKKLAATTISMVDRFPSWIPELSSPSLSSICTSLHLFFVSFPFSFRFCNSFKVNVRNTCMFEKKKGTI